MKMDFVIPGTQGPTITASRSLLGNIELSIDGRELKKHGWFSQSVWVAASDGKQHEVKLGGGLFTTTVEAGGQKLVIEPSMPWWQRTFILLPWVLIFVGGLIGGLFAGLAMELNRRWARADMRAPLKLVTMALTTLGAGGLWFGTVFALAWLFAPLPEYETGGCYRGWWTSSDEAVDLARVDCSDAHDTEVVGGFGLSDGPYPGTATIFEWADQACPAEFRAYMGVPIEQSSMLLQYLYPDEELWARGSRDIDCVVTGGPTESWSGSLAASGR